MQTQSATHTSVSVLTVLGYCCQTFLLFFFLDPVLLSLSPFSLLKSPSVLKSYFERRYYAVSMVIINLETSTFIRVLPSLILGLLLYISLRVRSSTLTTFHITVMQMTLSFMSLKHPTTRLLLAFA